MLRAQWWGRGPNFQLLVLKDEKRRLAEDNCVFPSAEIRLPLTPLKNGFYGGSHVFWADVFPGALRKWPCVSAMRGFHAVSNVNCRGLAAAFVPVCNLRLIWGERVGSVPLFLVLWSTTSCWVGSLRPRCLMESYTPCFLWKWWKCYNSAHGWASVRVQLQRQCRHCRCWLVNMSSCLIN